MAAADLAVQTLLPVMGDSLRFWFSIVSSERHFLDVGGRRAKPGLIQRRET